MRTILITGGASGIGRATVERCRRQGDRVITVDIQDADIQADLASEAGRAHMIEEVRRLAPDGLDAVLAAAGIARADRAEDMVSINYFGAIATLEGVLPLLARQRRPRAVAITSTASMLPGNEAIVAACLGNGEIAARAAAAATPDVAYAASKRALALWLRRTATLPRWAGAGVLLNAASPGVVVTPMTQALLEQEETRASLRQISPIAVGNYAQADDIAELLCFLLGFENGYLLGQIIYIDGGADAIMRSDLF